MLNALSVLLRDGNKDGYLRAAKSMERQGFEPVSRFEWPAGALGTWGRPDQRAVENCEVRSPSGVACCIGPLWYKGQFGRSALEMLLADLGANGRIDETLLRGNFALFLSSPDHCLLMNDVLGLVRVHISSDGFFFSTSWLAACAYEGSVQLDEDAAIEYVLLGASHSDRTVARGITTLQMAHTLDLTQRKTLARLPSSMWDRGGEPLSFGAAIQDISDHLLTVCREITTAFPDHTRAALSGGFDSRLIVAGLLACGSRPKLFVYGEPMSEDVVVGRTVASGVGLSIDLIDKGKVNALMPRPDLERLIHNALFFDGLPNDGIYDSGTDEQTRLGQSAESFIALNGGGGEIFRNFFHLPNRRLHAKDIVRSFYRGFDPKVFRRSGGLDAYENGLVRSIGRALDIANSTVHRALQRDHVELLYPFFRCHHWMSVNNSVAVRHGYYATPLLDINAVRLAWRLPMAWKNAGALQSGLIARLHHGIASQPSSYGFRFSDGPNWRARLSEYSSTLRPVFARPAINAARRRLRGLGVDLDILAHCRSLLPGEWQLDPLLDLERLPDAAAFARALAVEVAWRELIA